jgi:hypothetical protein
MNGRWKVRGGEEGTAGSLTAVAVNKRAMWIGIGVDGGG